MSNKFSESQARNIVDLLLREGEARIAAGQSGTYKNLESRTIDLSSSPLNPIEVGFPFNAVFVQEATDTSTNINLKFYDQNQGTQSLSLSKNDTLSMEFPITKAYLEWDSQSGKSIKLVFLRGGTFRPGSLFTEVSSSVDGNSISTSAPVTVTTSAAELISQNLSRTVLNLYCSAPIYIAASASATYFYPLPAGWNQLKNTAQIYAKTLAGTSTVDILEES